MKIVINSSYGGFGLSHEAIRRYAQLKDLTLFTHTDGTFNHYYKIPVEDYDALRDIANETRDYSELNKAYFSEYEIPRTDPALIQVVEELKEKANGHYAELRIIDIPDDVKWEIEEYDGLESVVEVSRRWN